jgi:hypothetical protein
MYNPMPNLAIAAQQDNTGRKKSSDRKAAGAKSPLNKQNQQRSDDGVSCTGDTMEKTKRPSPYRKGKTEGKSKHARSNRGVVKERLLGRPEGPGVGTVNAGANTKDWKGNMVMSKPLLVCDYGRTRRCGLGR